MSSSFELTGMDELLRNLSALGVGIGEAAARPLKVEAESVMTDSKENYVPVDDGILRGSGYVGDPEITKDGVSIEMGYGGAAADYAVVQHENLEFNHPGGKQPKYLERPLQEAERGMDGRLGAGIEREIERLVK